MALRLSPRPLSMVGRGCKGGGEGVGGEEGGHLTLRSRSVTANVTKPAAHRGTSSLSTAAMDVKGRPGVA